VTAVASHTKARDPAAPATPAVAPPVLALTGKSLLALTQDARLLETLRKVSNPAHEVYATASEVDLATALLAHQAGVVVFDTAASATPPGNLAARLHAQFPDVVLVVTGRAEEQARLSSQITDGSVHRFLHKPLSEQRVRLFVESAWRRHAEAQAIPRRPALAPSAPSRRRRGWQLIAAAVLVSAAAVGWLLWRTPQTPPPTPPPVTRAPAAPAAVDAALESLLARADHALAGGDLVTPPQQSAAALYRAALEHNTRDPRARNGLEQVIERLLADAEAQLQARHLDEAQHLAEQARTVNPDHPRVAFLMAQIGAQRERAVLDKAQRTAATGNVSGALAVLEDAARGGHHSTLVDQAREQLAQKQLDERVAEFLRRGRDAQEHGQLIEPPEQNARFFVESAQALAANAGEVRQAAAELLTRVKEAAAAAISAGNPNQAELLTAAAADLGASPAEVAALRTQAQKLRAAAKAAGLGQLSLAFNERLANGRLLEPSGDSAKFYLAQLLQADAGDHATQLARTAFNARLLEEARTALRAQDYAGARRWLTEAHAAGADAAGISGLEAEVNAAQDETQQASGFVSASTLVRTHYLAPEFPIDARRRGIDGWVDLQFLVNTDGSVGELTVIGAQPVGIFEQAALDAVRRWRYQPAVRGGQPVTQRARLRMRFAMQR